LSKRIDTLSRYFLDKPYLDAPLGGGPGKRESLTISTRGFDCVTYVETVLALANSGSPEAFPRLLQRIRYDHGRIGWRTRNHYMTRWATNNRDAGLLRSVTTGPSVQTRHRLLDVVPGIEPGREKIRCFPKRYVTSGRLSCKTGDLMLFVSVKKRLDVFHLGFVINVNGKLKLRHASRTAGRVIDENLESFLLKHRMSGVIVLRPI
jgi:hypothetical protein